jgi:surface carbohydrate biosynthesis protein (TIGR04326 family)
MTQEQSLAGCKTFHVWDADGAPGTGAWAPVLWREFAGPSDESVYSIPRLVEERAEELRSEFLKWVAVLGETKVTGARVVDHLELRPGFSYWWMTLIVEKSYGKSTRLFDAIRLLALDKLAKAHSPEAIILTSGDCILAEAMRRWCQNANLDFDWRKTIRGKSVSRPLARMFHLLPHPLRAAVVMARQLWHNWPLRTCGKYHESAADEAITFVDYLFHLDPAACKLNKFGSKYWTDLVDVLDGSNAPVNWLHHFVAHEAVPNASSGCKLISKFNQQAPGIQAHSFLEAGIGWTTAWNAICDYARVHVAGMRLRGAREYFRPVQSAVDFWPLFEQDWKNSLFGSVALSNCLALNLYESVLRRLPRQKMGVYLQENQGWEKALIYAWKASGHGRLVGVPHATIRYWDLRYFSAKSNYLRTGRNDLPLPDVVALNGPAAIVAYRQGAYPRKDIIEVEALRYLFLAKKRAVKAAEDSLCVLILGDYLSSATKQQMAWFCAAAPHLPPSARCLVKPHPNCPINAADYPGLRMEITNDSFDQLLGGCDVAYTSNITSAAVDAYYAGIPVISVLDGNALNMSPLRGTPDVTFVSSPAELSVALLQMKRIKHGRPAAYFCLDLQLPRWRKLLNLRIASSAYFAPQR